MEGNRELKKLDIKICTYFFNDIIKIEDFDFGILIAEKLF